MIINSLSQHILKLKIVIIVTAIASLQFMWLNIWWEDSELMVAHLLNGNLLGFTYGNLYYMENYGLQIIYVWLQNITQWYFLYPALLCVYVLISICIVLYHFLQHQAITKQHRYIQLLIAVFWAIILLQSHLLQLQFTRISYLMCTVGLALYYFYSKNKIQQGFGLLWFSIGFYTRMESGLIVCMLLSIIYLLLVYKKTQLKYYIITLLIPLLVIGPGIASMLYEIHFDTHYYNLIEPDIEYKILERGDIKPLAKNASEKEQAIYKAAHHWLLSDSIIISPLYLRSIVKNDATIMLPFQKIKQSILEYIMQYPAMLLAFIIHLVFIVAWINQKKSYKIYLYIAVFTILLCLPIFTIKTSARIIEPYIIMSLLLWYAYWYKQSIYKKWLKISLSILFITSVVLIYQNQKNAQQNHLNWQQQATCYKTYIQLTKQYKVAGLSGLDLMHSPVFYKIPFRFKWLPLDMAQLSYTPEGAAFISNSFPCHRYDIACRYKHLQQQAANTLILAEPDRIATMQFYLEKVYQIKLILKPLPIECTNNSQSIFYQIQ